ncbi:MAG TPA: 7TM diverse intracellular signaling domain-containing protein [Flavipsychrobacter sp.]|nr:7TM diverse intracellular signaling domain-containing protein [Flavipsychrobacter sp.]
MHFKKSWLALLVALLAFLNADAQVVYKQGDGILTIGKSVEYFIDSTEQLTFDNILTRNINYSQFDKAVPNMAIVDYPVWLKLAVRNSSESNRLSIQVAQALLDTIEFYYPVAGGNYAVNKTGEAFKFNTRPGKNHIFVYDINIEPGETKYYYFRIKSEDNLELPIFLGTKEQVVHSDLTKNILFGIFFGIIIVMFFYNLFIYFTVKDPIYLFYVVYILAVGLIQGTIEGYTFQYLWPNSTFVATRGFYIFTALVNISGLEFVRRFLHTKTRLPKLDKFAIFLYVVYSIAILLSVLGLFNASYQILQSFAGIVSLYMLTLSVLMAKQGYRPAKFFIIAWIPLIIGIIIYVMKDVGVLNYNMFTNYSITIGSALEVILLSFALADKINILEAEKRVSQAQALRASQENERIIREQNIILESKVNERTTELKASNEELAKTLRDLQEAETQLVESEKMASLGQLTAGIAHEINNPINFVTSNVNPLKRDVDLLIGMVDQMEEISTKENSLSEKREEINALKEDMDFDYLKEEIDFLLKGIHDGASRTAEIVKGLRVFSRLDEDDLKKADINEGLDSTLVIVNHLLNNTITIEKKYSGIPLVECFPGKLNQVFLNMMSNAIHAIHKRWDSEPQGKLTLSSWNDEDNVYVSIKDNGTGMDEETSKKIFEPFFTTKDVGEGTGLGMSIVYNTIRKHNGSIQINSALGEGTEFIITLPVIHKLVKA